MDGSKSRELIPRSDRVLVAGVSRSGTSWLGQALGSLPSAKYCYEPDIINAAVEKREASGSREFAPYPEIEASENGGPHRALWNMVFAGGLPLQEDGHLDRRAFRVIAPLRKLPPPVLNSMVKFGSRVLTAAAKKPDLLIVKSVFSQFCMEWLLEQYSPTVVLIQRGPLNVVSSWRALHIPLFDLLTRPSIVKKSRDWYDGLVPSAEDPEIMRLAWAVGMLTSAMGESLDMHPDWMLVTHDDLIKQPVESLKQIVASLGLDWSDEVANYLERSNRHGSGITPERITSEQGDRWKGRLSPEETEQVELVLSRFQRKGWIRPN